MRPAVLFANLAMVCKATGTKVIFDWAIKYLESQGFTWEEGTTLIQVVTAGSVLGRLFSGFIAV